MSPNQILIFAGAELNFQAFNQSIEIAITNNFENFMYDVFVFEVDEDSGKSEDFECYKQVVYTKLWD